MSIITTSAPSFDTIYFSIPANTYNSNALSYVPIDRGISEQSEIKIKEFKSNVTGLKQILYDGINTSKTIINFYIKSLTSSEVLLISKFFESLLGTTEFTLYNTLTGENDKSIVVTQWSINYTSSLYADIVATAELIY